MSTCQDATPYIDRSSFCLFSHCKKKAASLMTWVGWSGMLRSDMEAWRGGKGRKRGGGGPQPHFGSSSLVVVWCIGEGKLQPVSFGQKNADFLVAPVHRG